MKNIVFCADGTWNGPGELDDGGKSAITTNVFKLFVNLDGQDTSETALLGKEQERIFTGDAGAALQCADLHGVGDSNNFLVRDAWRHGGHWFDYADRPGYTFISRNYAAGDKIFIVGFSRGASRRGRSPG